MSDDGSVNRDIMIEVLQRNGAEVSVQQDQADMFLISKGEVLEIVPIPGICRRRLIHYLSRKFTTPIHHFYNPLMAPALPDAKNR
jgi:hypothetical protein